MSGILSFIFFQGMQQIPGREILNWFSSRLSVGLAAGIILGILLAAVHLNRLSMEVGDYSVNHKARRLTIVYGILFAAVAAALLFLDISTVRFENYSFSNWKDVFIGVYSLIIQASSLLTFLLSLALTTRFARNSRCKYALIPR